MFGVPINHFFGERVQARAAYLVALNPERYHIEAWIEALMVDTTDLRALHPIYRWIHINREITLTDRIIASLFRCLFYNRKYPFIAPLINGILSIRLLFCRGIDGNS